MKLEQNYELRTFEDDLALVLTFSKKKLKCQLIYLVVL